MTRKILILSANPKATSRLRLDEEIREINDGLSRAKHRDQFELVQRWAVRPRDIQRAMLESNPHIVHFAGHGAGEEGLIFEDEAGQPKFVTTPALAGLFQLFADQVECVVLNGCYSQVQAEAISEHIHYVIGIQQTIGDKAAISFAASFYDALGAGRPFEFAYKLGCNAIQMEGIQKHLIPILINTKKPKILEKLVYDSQKEPEFYQWSLYSSVSGFRQRVRLIERVPDGAITFEIKALATESVGVNKSLRILKGRIEFEYKVVFSEAIQPNVYFCMIPMQETGIGRTGLIEVGTNIQADPQNPYSPYRKRFYVPMEYYGENHWYRASISFDFSQIPTAFYSIFAPRINEGCGNPAPAQLLTTNFRAFSLE